MTETTEKFQAQKAESLNQAAAAAAFVQNILPLKMILKIVIPFVLILFWKANLVESKMESTSIRFPATPSKSERREFGDSNGKSIQSWQGLKWLGWVAGLIDIHYDILIRSCLRFDPQT